MVSKAKWASAAVFGTLVGNACVGERVTLGRDDGASGGAQTSDDESLGGEKSGGTGSAPAAGGSASGGSNPAIGGRGELPSACEEQSGVCLGEAETAPPSYLRSTIPCSGSQVCWVPVSATESVCDGFSRSPVVQARDQTNLKFEVDFQLASLRVSKNSSDLVLDWSNLTVDLVGRPLGTTDITSVLLVASASLGLEELAERLVRARPIAAEDLTLVAYQTTQLGKVTSGELGDLRTAAGTRLAEDSSFAEIIGGDLKALVLLQDGPLGEGDVPQLASGLRAVVGLDFADGPTVAELSNAMSQYIWSAEFGPTAATPIVPNHASGMVTWDGTLSERADGDEFVASRISEVTIARLGADFDLEKDLLELRAKAKRLWVLEASLEDGQSNPDWGDIASSVDFSNLATAQGDGFPGIASDSGDQYVLALWCGRSANCGAPVPWYATRLVGCEQPGVGCIAPDEADTDLCFSLEELNDPDSPTHLRSVHEGAGANQSPIVEGDGGQGACPSAADVLWFDAGTTCGCFDVPACVTPTVEAGGQCCYRGVTRCRLC